MPSRKRDAESEERFESAEEEDEDVKPKVKRQSTSKQDKATASKATETGERVLNEEHEGMEENDQGEKYAKLSEYRRVTVRTYNKMVLVDIREYYKDKKSGEMKPGSKGISLTKEQWTALRGVLGDIDSAVESIEAK